MSLTYGFEYLGDRGVGMAFAATAKPASPSTTAVLGSLATTVGGCRLNR